MDWTQVSLVLLFVAVVALWLRSLGLEADISATGSVCSQRRHRHDEIESKMEAMRRDERRASEAKVVALADSLGLEWYVPGPTPSHWRKKKGGK